MSSNDNDAVLTVTELMARWKVSRKGVLALIHTGRLQAFRVGERAYRIPMEDVKRVEREREQAA